MKFRSRNLLALGDMICGNLGSYEPGSDNPAHFPYRSSSYLTEFFQELDMEWVHDGSTRHRWVADVLEQVLAEPHGGPSRPPDAFCRVVNRLMDRTEATNESSERPRALAMLNEVLGRESFEAFYAEDGQCYLRHVNSGQVATVAANPHRPLTPAEAQRRTQLAAYLDRCSEDELIEEVLLPLFRQLGFHRITAAGHRDKALEYGKDVWMRYTLPTQHVLYFGIQAKRGKLDAAGMTGRGSANIAEIHNQVLMMLAHEVFDPEVSRRVLVDHAFIVAGGVITKQARNWLGNALDDSRRSQILFMDRDDILDQYTVNNVPLPASAVSTTAMTGWSNESPF